MNLLPGLQIVLDELMQRFGTQIEHVHAPQPNELYLHTKLELAGALCSAFYKKHQGRLAGVFAEDARAQLVEDWARAVAGRSTTSESNSKHADLRRSILGILS